MPYKECQRSHFVTAAVMLNTRTKERTAKVPGNDLVYSRYRCLPEMTATFAVAFSHNQVLHQMCRLVDEDPVRPMYFSPAMFPRVHIEEIYLREMLGGIGAAKSLQSLFAQEATDAFQ